MALAVVLAVSLLASCGGNPERGEAEPTARPGAGDALLPIVLTTWLHADGASPASAEPVALAHIAVSPVEPGDNRLAVAITDLAGTTILPDPAPVLTVTALAPGADPVIPALATDPDAPAWWNSGPVPLDTPGWYELVATLPETGATATVDVLLPDPTIHGSAALDLSASDLEAEALFDRAIDRYAAWDSAGWRETLGSGSDVLVVTDFAMTDRNDAPAAQAQATRYIGAFQPRSDGTDPAPPERDVAEAITIGGDAWRTRDGGPWETSSTLGAATQQERADVFDGATSFADGGTATVGGRETRIVTLYVPASGGQSEAWFAWWVDIETSDPVRIAMVTTLHFMVWVYEDIDGAFTIDPPDVPESTPTTRQGAVR